MGTIIAEKLKPALVNAGLITPEVFDAAAAEAGRLGVPLDQVLGDKELVPDQYLGQLVAETMGFKNAKFDAESIPDHVLRIVPDHVAAKMRAAVFAVDDGTVSLAMRDPNDVEFRFLIEKKMGLRVIPFFVTERGFRSILERYRTDLDSAVRRILEESGDKKERKEGDDTIVRIVDLLMNYAYDNGASDVHIEPREHEVVVRYRIDGILHDVVNLSKDFLNAVVARIKVLSRLRTDEHFAAQDGKFQDVIAGDRINVRVSILPILYGEKVVMRLLMEKGRKFGFVDLGLSERDAKTVDRHLRKTFGLILATGPTGSGKTTMMYAMLKILNTPDVNIATIEDPIEYALNGVNQIQVNTKTGLTFAHGLRSIVRQDPDVIMVGEIRDEETANISVNAAMTGHLVLSTVHTNDAATTLPRFLDMKVEPFLIASTINLIIAQRLVRKICNRCIVSYTETLEAVKDNVPAYALASAFPKRKKTAQFFKGKGCTTCGHTGYHGRIGIFEMLEMTETIRDLVMKGANAGEINVAAIAQGMTTMLQDGIQKALQGLTTLDEVYRAIGVG